MARTAEEILRALGMDPFRDPRDLEALKDWQAEIRAEERAKLERYAEDSLAIRAKILNRERAKRHEGMAEAWKQGFRWALVTCQQAASSLYSEDTYDFDVREFDIKRIERELDNENQ